MKLLGHFRSVATGSLTRLASFAPRAHPAGADFDSEKLNRFSQHAGRWNYPLVPWED